MELLLEETERSHRYLVYFVEVSSSFLVRSSRAFFLTLEIEYRSMRLLSFVEYRSILSVVYSNFLPIEYRLILVFFHLSSLE